MKFLPECSEGFRRLSVVAVIIVFIGITVFMLKQMLDYNQQAINTCFNLNDPKKECIGFANNSYCFNAERTFQEDCLKEYKFLSDPVIAGGFAAFYVFGIYLTLFLIRAFGWIAEGFAKPKSN